MQHFWLQDNLSKGEVSEVRGWIPQPGTKGDLQCSELLQWDKVGLLFFRGNSSLVCFSTPQSAHWVTFLNSGCSEHTLLTVHLRRSAQNIFFEISWEEELHWSFSECFIFILEFKKKKATIVGRCLQTKKWEGSLNVVWERSERKRGWNQPDGDFEKASSSSSIYSWWRY